ncbi:hypothetical protein HYDPIDRAFT_116979 [Hydnomerulius pinastri MD-312]|uniref:Unplaced genomic scaffold scaffold_37, whole genome shotgun sequence n=1 Tax=Hydnomerulius pinastri MD-312 TaxID=994086 RepID=A0A0C9VRN4_9AGAM|nr:hypothetical protein HYDPIDRAFT_116979 [Hydnomerulius pinastri MD-312]
MCVYLQPLAGPSNQWVRTRIGELIPLPRDGEFFENTAIFVKEETSFFDPRKLKRAVSIDTIATYRKPIKRTSSFVRPHQKPVPPVTTDEVPPEPEVTVLPPTPPLVSATLPLPPTIPVPPLPTIPSHSSDIRRRDPQPTPPPRKDARKHWQRPTAIPTEFSTSEPGRLPSQKRREFSSESQMSPLLSPLQESRGQTPPHPEGPVSKTWRSKSDARAHPERPQFEGRGNPKARSASPPSTSNRGKRSAPPTSERARSSGRESRSTVPQQPRGSSLTVPGAPPVGEQVFRSSTRVERSDGSPRAQRGRSNEIDSSKIPSRRPHAEFDKTAGVQQPKRTSGDTASKPASRSSKKGTDNSQTSPFRSSEQVERSASVGSTRSQKGRSKETDHPKTSPHRAHAEYDKAARVQQPKRTNGETARAAETDKR